MVLTGLELTALGPEISLPPPSHAGIISIVSAPSTWLPGRSLDFFFSVLGTQSSYVRQALYH